jgi:hypothetical protein
VTSEVLGCSPGSVRPLSLPSPPNAHLPLPGLPSSTLTHLPCLTLTRTLYVLAPARLPSPPQADVLSPLSVSGPRDWRSVCELPCFPPCPRRHLADVSHSVLSATGHKGTPHLRSLLLCHPSPPQAHLRSSSLGILPPLPSRPFEPSYLGRSQGSLGADDRGPSVLPVDSLRHLPLPRVPPRPVAHFLSALAACFIRNSLAPPPRRPNPATSSTNT